MKQKQIIELLCGLSLLPFSLGSCSADGYETNTVSLKRVEESSTVFYIESCDQLNSIVRYEDAVVFITLEGCHYCEGQRELLSEYITETNALIYEVTRNIYLEAYNDETNEYGEYANLLPTLSAYPTFLFYKEGKLKDSHVGELGHGIDDFKKNFSPYVSLTNLYILNDYSTSYINEIKYQFWDNSEAKEETKLLDTLGYGTERLDATLSEETEPTVYYSWRRCTDCRNFRKFVLNEFLDKNSKEMEKLYMYEVDGYYLLKRQSDETLKNLGLNMWSDFSLKYHLYDDSFYNTDALGNKAGYVPTLVTYKSGSFKSMDVFANENSPMRNQDGTLSFANAFHSECKEVRSKTVVEENDYSSETYQKALKEITDSAIEIDKEKGKAYLESELL